MDQLGYEPFPCIIRVILCGFLILGLLGIPLIGFAHPLDITFTSAYYGNRTMQCEMNIHPYEANYLLKKHGVPNATADDYRNQQRIFKNYIQRHFTISQGGSRCSFQWIGLADVDEAQMYATGLPCQFTITCPQRVDRVDIHNSLFIDDFMLQTNKITFLPQNFDTQSQVNEINEIIFTRKVHQLTYYVRSTHLNIGNEGADSDGDSLSDAFERLYGTNPQAKDSDGDGFEDWLELSYGFDPNSTEPSPGQEQAAIQMGLENEYYSASALRQELGEEQTSPSIIPLDDNHEENILSIPDASNGTAAKKADVYVDDSGKTIIQLQPPEPEDEPEFDFEQARAKHSQDPFKSKQLESTLKTIQAQFDSGGFLAIFIIAFSVFILGFLHALQAGHGKTILVAYLVEQKKTYRDALRFVTIFTVTHLIDIVFLGVAYYFLVGTLITGDLSNLIVLLSLIGLLIVATYLLITGLRQYRNPSTAPSVNEDTIPVHSEKESDKPKKKKWSPLLVGFLVGLVPCPFGWGLFFFLVSIDQIGWILPLIGIFGVGIWVCLALFGFVTIYAKGKLFHRFSKLAPLSQIISGGLMLIFTILSAILWYNKVMMW
jgi:nickel/cobalt transporter (NicO) family protein